MSHATLRAISSPFVKKKTKQKNTKLSGANTGLMDDGGILIFNNFSLCYVMIYLISY